LDGTANTPGNFDSENNSNSTDDTDKDSLKEDGSNEMSDDKVSDKEDKNNFIPLKPGEKS
jgi:hypothetical protein